jgi:hypothetical protein
MFCDQALKIMSEVSRSGMVQNRMKPDDLEESKPLSVMTASRFLGKVFPLVRFPKT